MDTFYELINQIASLDDDKIKKLEKSYDDMFDAMISNTELINETRHRMKESGMTIVDIDNDKENLYALVDHMKATQGFSKEKARLLDRVVKTTMAIYDKVIETGSRDITNIAVELCHKNAKMPVYAHEDDAGFDFYLPEDFTIKAHEYGKIAPTGIKMSIPTGYELQIRPRSGNSVKTTLRISNAPGTIDCGYADEIGIICDNIGDEDLEFKAGDRIAQGVLAICPKGIFNQIDDINKVPGSNRGGGYGSTGK